MLWEEYLKKESLIDFNDMIHHVVDLLNKYTKIRDKYQERFKFILVDEYQDVSAAQVELLKLLLNKSQVS